MDDYPRYDEIRKESAGIIVRKGFFYDIKRFKQRLTLRSITDKFVLDTSPAKKI
jgi:hypothetical protein